MFKRVNRREFCGARKYVLIEQLSSVEKVKGDQLFPQTRVFHRFALQSFTHLNSSKFTLVEAR